MKLFHRSPVNCQCGEFLQLSVVTTSRSNFRAVCKGLTRARLWGQREDERGGAFPPGDGAAEALCLEVPQLLHEVGALHEGHVGEVEVAQDLGRKKGDRNGIPIILILMSVTLVEFYH